MPFSSVSLQQHHRQGKNLSLSRGKLQAMNISYKCTQMQDTAMYSGDFQENKNHFLSPWMPLRLLPTSEHILR